MPEQWRGIEDEAREWLWANDHDGDDERANRTLRALLRRARDDARTEADCTRDDCRLLRKDFEELAEHSNAIRFELSELLGRRLVGPEWTWGQVYQAVRKLVEGDGDYMRAAIAVADSAIHPPLVTADLWLVNGELVKRYRELRKEGGPNGD
jgi:hypothetical protein